MTHVDEINTQIPKIEAECESAILTERVTALAEMKADMKPNGFKTSDFKGSLLTRAKLGANKVNAGTKTAVKILVK